MKALKKIKRSAVKVYKKRKQKKAVKEQIAMANRMIRESGETIPELTQAQVREIQEYWKQFGIKVTPEWHKLYYGITGKADPRFVPNRVFHRQIKGKTNDEGFASVWSDKAYLDKFVTGAKTVHNVIRNVDGHFYDENFNRITIDEADHIIRDYDRLVVKPTIYTDTGKGVCLLTKPFDMHAIDRDYCSNYVLQLPLKQHPEMSKLNASSINTVRFNSVLLEDGAHVMSAFVKVGQAGEFADNSGHDRFFIGISPDGKYNSYAIDHQLHKYKEIPSGYAFAGKEVPCFREACRAIEKAHESIPHFGFAFWDVCISEDGTPVIVEMNLRYPNSKIPQAAYGPFMGEYTERIIRYVQENERKFTLTRKRKWEKEEN